MHYDLSGTAYTSTVRLLTVLRRINPVQHVIMTPGSVLTSQVAWSLVRSIASLGSVENLFRHLATCIGHHAPNLYRWKSQSYDGTITCLQGVRNC